MGEGAFVGAIVGDFVGDFVGLELIPTVGLDVGDFVGLAVGCDVTGAVKGASQKHRMEKSKFQCNQFLENHRHCQ